MYLHIIMMQHFFSTLFLLALVSSAQSLIFQWGYAATGASGRSCPGSLAAVIFTGEFNRLNDCSEKELRDIYASGNCCIDFIAECNYVERAWWTKIDVLKYEPLCSPMLRKPQFVIRERRRRFMSRVIRRKREKEGRVILLT